MYKNMSYSEREEKIKGMPCATCGRNVPDPSPSAKRVWCWQCVLYGKFDGAEVQPTHTEAPETARKPIERAKGGSNADATLENVAKGAFHFVFEGPKGTVAFTKGAGDDTIAVWEPKGYTTYNLKDEDHARILRGRWDRWARKAEPIKKDGKMALKGLKLEVRIKGGD